MIIPIDFFSTEKIEAYMTQKPLQLRCPFYVGKDKNKAENDRIAFIQKLRIQEEDFFIANQVHGTNIQIISEKNNPSEFEADAMLTNVSGKTLCIIASDCVPILLYDPVQKVIWVIHAGRIGTLWKICIQTVQKMWEIYNTYAKNIQVYIAPSICQNCYELKSSDIENISKKYIKNSKNSGKILLDLKTMNFNQLQEAWILKENIKVSSTCTYESDNFHSYRRNTHTPEEGYGNNGFMIALKNK